MLLSVTFCALLRVAALDDAALSAPAAEAIAWAAEEAFGSDDDHGPLPGGTVLHAAARTAGGAAGIADVDGVRHPLLQTMRLNI